MIDVVLVGARGRMGREIESAAATRGDVRIKARIDPAGPQAGDPGYQAEGESLERSVARGDVVVDFSTPEGCRAAARACGAAGAALVTGTTGLGADAERELAAAAKKVAVLKSANFSLGIVALRRAVAAALEVLPAHWDIEIVERHHRLKVDSPSGTALAIAGEIARRRGANPPTLRHGREGRVGARPAGEIGLHALRGGTWVGDHTILIAGDGESIELRHVAESRAAFAHGALHAAHFVSNAAPGLYTLDDIPLPGGRAG